MKSPESRPTLEQKDPIDPTIIAKGVETALKIVADMAEGEARDERLEYHTPAHTEMVVRRYKEIIAVIQRTSSAPSSERDVQIGELGAAFHDTVRIEGEVMIPEPATSEFSGMSKKIRPMPDGKNEKDSETLAAYFMDAMNERYPGAFTESDKAKIKQQIAVTVPGIDMERHTVTQPNLTEHSSAIERALALADLSTAGMGTPEEFLAEGDALFRENNLDIADAVEGFKNGVAIDERMQAYFVSRMTEWTAGQPKFARGRKDLLDEDLKGLEPDTTAAIKSELFTETNFDASIAAAEARIEHRSGMGFFELARDMGYDL